MNVTNCEVELCDKEGDVKTFGGCKYRVCPTHYEEMKARAHRIETFMERFKGQIIDKAMSGYVKDGRPLRTLNAKKEVFEELMDILAYISYEEVK